MNAALSVSFLVVLILACGFATAEIQEHELGKPDSEPVKSCNEECGNNSDCKDGKCICRDGYYKKIGQDDCEESVCDQLCAENTRCVNSTCICNEGFENIGLGGVVNCTTILVSNEKSCDEECGQNSECKQGQCICNEGFYKKLGSEDCEESVCNTTCRENEECVKSKCICQEGYENFGEGGLVNCTKPVVGLTAPTTQIITITTSTSTEPSSTTTTPLTSSTQHITTSSHKPTTTSTAKPTPSPHPHPHKRKTAMSAWAITGIIILVASIVGFGGFMIYRHKQRGSYSATSTSSR